MKVSNKDMISFLNNARSIVSKKIPHKLFFAISQNIMAFEMPAKLYTTEIEKVDKENVEEINELLSIENEVVIQTVPEKVLDIMDESPKFDALTGPEFMAIEFMIEKSKTEE